VIKPRPLMKGETIGVIAPASTFEQEDLFAGIKVLEEWGYRVKYHQEIFRSYRYLAGDDQRRAEELKESFADEEVKAILCARGGYGSMRIISQIPPSLIQKHPKIFVGYSDLTSLLLFLQHRCQLVTFHGPVVAKDLTPSLGQRTRQSFVEIIEGSSRQIPIKEPGMKILKEGAAEGTLTGGCLSLLAASLGTPIEPDLNETILFLEETGEKPYQIDRMLTQMLLSGKLDGVAGFVFGTMEKCIAGPHEEYGVEGVISEVLQDLSVPILYGVPSGHCSDPLVLPFGVKAAIREGALWILEEAVKRDH